MSHRFAVTSSAAMLSSLIRGACRVCAPPAVAISKFTMSSCLRSTRTPLLGTPPRRLAPCINCHHFPCSRGQSPWCRSGLRGGPWILSVQLASRKSRQATKGVLRDQEIVQSSFGRIVALHHAARAFLITAMADLVTALPSGGPRLLQARALFRTACAHAGETAVQIVDKLAAETGAASIFETCPLERYVRDTHAATKHITMSASSYVVAGRLGLGLDPGTTEILTITHLERPITAGIAPSFNSEM